MNLLRALCLVPLFYTMLATPAPAQPAQEATAPLEERPNLLWISAEDLSPRLGAYGDSLARTPNLDRLAEDGVRYTRAFTTAGVCAPSRSAIITGMYQNGIGTHHMRTSSAPDPIPAYEAVPPPYVKAFPEYLRAAGYFATNNEKTDYQFGTPFTIWHESSGDAHWRDRPREDQPFFAVFNFTTTHESQLFGPDTALVTDPSAVAVPPYYPDTPDVRQEIAHHYDNVAALDRQVGDLLGQLEEDGLLEETIVVFWGDHGDGLPRAKRWLYDSGLRVPLLVRVPETYREWAGIEAPGSADDQLVSLMDLGPTMLSLAGVDGPEHVDGRAFLGPQRQPAPDYLFGARDRFDTKAYDMIRSARGARFHYLRNFYPEKPYVLPVTYRNNTDTMQELFRLKAAGTLDGAAQLWMRDRRPPEELYDTEADPHEVHNLAEDSAYADALREMRHATNQWMERIDDLGGVPEAQMVRRMWPGMEQPVTKAPVIYPRATTQAPPYGDDTLAAPVEIDVYDLTQGASIEYRQGAGGPWMLYRGPVRLTEAGAHRFQARAVRYGYQPSDTTDVTFTITDETSR